MSTPSRIFNEQVFKVESSTSGSKTFEFQVENDGFILYMEYVSGSSNSIVKVIDIRPGDMTDITIDTVVLQPNQTTPDKLAYIAGRQAAITVNWEGETTLLFTVRAVSAEAIRVVNESAAMAEEANQLTRDLIVAVKSNTDAVEKVLNHMRFITEINNDAGEEF